MERDLPAFIAHRVRKLQTSKRLIEEIDVEPSPPARLKPGKLKSNAIKCIPTNVQVGELIVALIGIFSLCPTLIHVLTTISII